MNEHLDNIIAQLRECIKETTNSDAATKLDEAIWSIVDAQCYIEGESKSWNVTNGN